MDKSGGELIMEKIILAMMLLLNLFFLYIYTEKLILCNIHYTYMCVYIWHLFVIIKKLVITCTS